MGRAWLKIIEHSQSWSYGSFPQLSGNDSSRPSLDKACDPLWILRATKLGPQGASSSDGSPGSAQTVCKCFLVQHPAQALQRGTHTMEIFMVQLTVRAAGSWGGPGVPFGVWKDFPSSPSHKLTGLRERIGVLEVWLRTVAD